MPIRLPLLHALLKPAVYQRVVFNAAGANDSGLQPAKHGAETAAPP